MLPMTQVFLILSIWLFMYAKLYLVFDERTVSAMYVMRRMSHVMRAAFARVPPLVSDILP